MGLTRKCGACEQAIAQDHHLELQVRVIRTEGPESQDETEQAYDDYCDGCIKSGDAIKDLLTGLEKYPKLREA